jgi:hypothetical protein
MTIWLIIDRHVTAGTGGAAAIRHENPDRCSVP